MPTNSDLGLSGPAAVTSMQDAVRQRILDALAKQQQEFSNQQKQAESDRADRQLQMQEQEHAAALQERQQQAAVGNATKLAPDLPMDQNLSPQAVGILRMGGMGGQAYAPPTMADTASGKPFVSQDANPSVNLGTPAQQKDAADSATIDRMANDPKTPPAISGFLRMRGALPKGENIPYQLITEPNGPPKAPEPLEQVVDPTTGKPTLKPRSQSAGLTPYHVPPSADSDEVVMQGATGPVIVNKRTGASRPVTDGSGAAMGLKPTSQQQTHEMAKGEAQDTLNQLEQALNDAKDLIGPGAGRVSNLEEMVGNQDPRINTLGVNMLATKAKVNAALTPSTRSAMNPAALAMWDNFLANKVSEPGLRATIQAMRGVVGKPAAATSGGTKLSAAELLKKYGG